MSSRVRVAGLLALVAGLLAVAEAVWVVAFLGRSSDGPAFVMALVAIVVVPVLLVAAGAVLVDGVPWWARVAVTLAVAASGFAAAGVEAGVFVGDDPADPAFIHWVAAGPQFALIAAVLLVGSVAWMLLRPLPLVRRVVVASVAAIVSPLVLALALLTGSPLVMLVAIAAPIALLTGSIVASRRRHGGGEGAKRDSELLPGLHLLEDNETDPSVRPA